uniref:UDP-glucuronosyltransferase n=1 Tax=Plutella xylostella TaxID=51655 RepID=A0A1L8D6R8_PLUXY
MVSCVPRALALLALALLAGGGSAARILCYFPVPSISHQVVFRPLTQELARRGHQVTVLTPDPAFPPGGAPANLTEVDFHDRSYELWREAFVKEITGNSKKSFNALKSGFTAIIDVIDYQLGTAEMRRALAAGPYDLVFTEALARPALVLGHIFDAPVIQISSFGALPPSFQVFGAPSHPILYPELSRKRLYNLSLWEKIEGIYEDLSLHWLQWQLQAAEDAVLARHVPGAPRVAELGARAQLLFLNVHRVFDGNRPAPPGVVYLGGLHQKPPQELPSDIKSYLDSSKHGVIYMSFGTNVSPSRLPAASIQLFNRVFAALPYDVLWKWDRDEMPGKADNVRISKWLPQADLLRHPKVVLFITQAGLQSTDEAITAGVPLLAFPMLGDQWYNAEKYEHLHIGLKRELAALTDELLAASIHTLIHDDSYRASIKRLGAVVADQPQSPLERAVWWTEHALRHRGAAHLRAPAAGISWTEFLMLDVLAAISAAVMAAVTLCVVVLRTIYVKLFKRSVKVKKN